MNNERLAILASLLLAIAVTLGAFGAHFLTSKIGESQMNVFKTGNFYHFVHGIAILIIYNSMKRNHNRYFGLAAGFFIAGIFLFSGSLYLLAIREWISMDSLQLLGPVTPIGGLCFITGWICTALAFAKQKNGN